MKAYSIIWKSPDFYSDHNVMIGSFHLCCAYLKMISKKMKGSGFTDILIESGLMSVGSMKGVVSGKNYSRSTNCHKVMAEAIERMLLLKYIDYTGSELLPKNSQSELRRTVNHFVTNRDKESLEIVTVSSILSVSTVIRNCIALHPVNQQPPRWSRQS